MRQSKRFGVRREYFGYSIYDKLSGSLSIAKVKNSRESILLKSKGEIIRISSENAEFLDNHSNRVDILSGPTYVEIYPTLFCNERCTFCYVGQALTNEPNSMKRELVDILVTKLKELGVFDISIAGGEPFVYKDLEYLVTSLRDHGIEVTISTNGTVGNEGLYRKFLEMGVKISVSFHSHLPEIASQIVNNSIAFEKTLSTIRMLKAFGQAPHITLVINQLNKEHVLDTIEFLCKEGIMGISISHMMAAGFAKVDQSQGIDFDAYKSLIKKAIIVAAPYGTKIKPQTYFPFLIDESKKFSIDPDIANLLYGTLDGRRVLYIDYKGDIYPTVYDFGASSLKIGNISNDDIKQVWENSPLLAEFRHAQPPSQCASCKHFEYCRGGPITNYNVPYFKRESREITCPLYSKVKTE